MKSNIQPTEEQILYAGLLEKVMYSGLALMFVTFALYIFGILPPAVPLDRVSSLWSQPVHDSLVVLNNDFLHQDQLPTGWSWLHFLGKGDFLNFLPIAMLSGVTILCCIAIIPGLFRRGDRAMALMAAGEVLILSLAASGLLVISGH